MAETVTNRIVVQYQHTLRRYLTMPNAENLKLLTRLSETLQNAGVDLRSLHEEVLSTTQPDLPTSQGNHDPLPTDELRRFQQELLALRQQNQQRTFELDVLYEISRLFSNTLDYDEIIHLMLAKVHRLLPEAISAGLLKRDPGFELTICATSVLSQDLQAQIRHRMLRTYSQLGKHPIGEEEVSTEFQLVGTLPSAKAGIDALRSVFQVPIIPDKQHAIVGLLFIGSDQENAFTEDLIRLFYTVANQAAGAIWRLHSLLAERKQAERQAMELAMERERSHILTSFIRDASHEFRTPLAVMKSALYMLENVSDNAHLGDYVQEMKAQVNHILGLVKSLVTMSRLDGEPTLRMRPLDLNEVFSFASAIVESEIINKQLTLETLLSDVPILVNGDFDELRTALENILHNAARYSLPGGKITLRTYRTAGHAVAEIRDTGIGISPDQLPHIFERFHRVDGAHTTRGFGLGLSIASKIVELHCGCIEAESIPTIGSTFYVKLPLYEQKDCA